MQGRATAHTGGTDGRRTEIRRYIDVSKAQVDVAIRPTGQRWVVSYDETGVEELVSQIADLGPALVLMEAKGVGSWSNSQMNDKAKRLGEIFGQDGTNTPTSLPTCVWYRRDLRKDCASPVGPNG